MGVSTVSKRFVAGRRLGAVVTTAALLTAACGSTPSAAPPGSPSPTPNPFSSTVPASPASKSFATFKDSNLTAVVAGPGVFTLMSTQGGDGDGTLITIDARTGRERWKAPTGNAQFLASTTDGPGSQNAAGAIIAADDVGVPQAGLTPASTRTEIVAREAADGRERWRTPVLTQPVDLAAGDRETLVAVLARGDVVAVVTTWQVQLLETATGRPRWSVRLDRPTGEDASNRSLGWSSAALGTEDLVATARLSRQTSQLIDIDTVTGRTKWRKQLSLGESSQVPAFGQVGIGARRAIVETAADIAGSKQEQSLTGYDLATGKQAWRTSGSAADSDNPVPLVLDWEDGTALRQTDGRLTAVNIQNGEQRWQQPEGVVAEAVRAGGGMTYLIGTSGSDRQVIGIRTRTREQTVVLAEGDAENVAVFTGALAVLTRSGVHFYR